MVNTFMSWLGAPLGKVGGHVRRQGSRRPLGEKTAHLPNQELAVGDEQAGAGTGDGVVRRPQRFGQLVFESARLAVHQLGEVVRDARRGLLAAEVIGKPEAEMPRWATSDQVRHERHRNAAHVAPVRRKLLAKLIFPLDHDL